MCFRYNIKSYAEGDYIKIHLYIIVELVYFKHYVHLFYRIMIILIIHYLSHTFYLYNVVQIYCVPDVFPAILGWAEPLVCFVIKKMDLNEKKKSYMYSI